jgi:putative transport protein
MAQAALDLLASSPILLLFVVAAIGYPLGRIRIFGISFGVAMVLFAALMVGALDPRLKLPAIISQIGLVVFVYTIGLASGASFFSGLRKNGLQSLGVVAICLGGAAFLTWAASVLAGMPPGKAVGGFTGALTNTPALAAVIDAIKDRPLGDPVVGYSIAYPMGVLGVILVQMVFWKFAPGHPQHDALKTQKDLVSMTVLVTRPEAAGLTVADLRLKHGLKVLFGRYRRSGEVSLAEAGTEIHLGDEMNLVGDQVYVERAASLLGGAAQEDLTHDRTHFDYRRIFVSNPEVAGRPLSELQIPQKLGAIVTRVRRGDVDFVPDAETILQPGDRVRVVADSRRMKEVTQFFGDSYKELSEIDILSFSLGIAVGTLLGLIPVPLPGGITLALGLAGGPLLASLVLGSLHRTGPIVWELPYSANLTLRQLGLILFFAGVGTNAGYAFWETLWTPSGLAILGCFAGVTMTTTTLFFAAGRLLFGVSKATLMGMAAGIHTQPAALSFAVEHCKSDQPNLGYASLFPIASIGKILSAQILLILLAGT